MCIFADDNKLTKFQKLSKFPLYCMVIQFLALIIPILIYLILPLVGIVLYTYLCKRMNIKKVPLPPKLAFFLIFFNYGALLIAILTAIFGETSGALSIGMFYLILISPILMLITGYLQYKLRNTSVYHEWAFILSVAYVFMLTASFILVFARLGM